VNAALLEDGFGTAMRTVLDHVLTLSWIRRHSHGSRQELLRFQADRLRRLIRHAYDRVPYYRRLFDEHRIPPESICTAADLERIPITSRKTLQALPDGEILARGLDPQHLNLYSTSGSAGRPITIRRSWLEDRMLAHIRLHASRAYGLTSADRVAVVKTVLVRHSNGSSGLQRAATVLGRRRKWHEVDCLQPAEAIAARLRELRPTIVSGYPGHLTRVCEAVDRSELRALGLRFIWTGGEVLTPAMRARIADAFGVRVYDSYGTYECDLVAWECPWNGAYHVCDDSLVLEVVRDGNRVGPGERGEAVVTVLHSYAMPFIRYSLGDLVERGTATCRCGAPYSTVREIRGRMIDFFELADGRLVHPYGVFIPIRESSPWMRHYQVTQLAPAHFHMRVVASSAPNDEALARVRTMAMEHLGPDVRFEIELVPDIAAEPNGKFQTYRSLVRSDYAGVR
jgi:phenylacetate-CoA ligase